LVREWKVASDFELWRLVTNREVYKARFQDWWNQEANIDFLIIPPDATPTDPHYVMRDAISTCAIPSYSTS